MKETSSPSLVEWVCLAIKPSSQDNPPPSSDTTSFPPVQRHQIPNSSGANSLQNTTLNSSTISATSSTELRSSLQANTIPLSLITPKTHPIPLEQRSWRKSSMRDSRNTSNKWID